MSLFEITPEIQLLAKPITPGWHPLELVKIDDKINDKGVKTTTFSHKVVDGPHKGAYVWVSVQHTPEGMAFNADYLDFIMSGQFRKPVKGAGEKKDVNLQTVKKNFWGEIKNKDYEGKTMNNLGKVADAKPADVKR